MELVWSVRSSSHPLWFSGEVELSPVGSSVSPSLHLHHVCPVSRMSWRLWWSLLKSIQCIFRVMEVLVLLTRLITVNIFKWETCLLHRGQTETFITMQQQSAKAQHQQRAHSDFNVSNMDAAAKKQQTVKHRRFTHTFQLQLRGDDKHKRENVCMFVHSVSLFPSYSVILTSPPHFIQLHILCQTLSELSLEFPSFDLRSLLWGNSDLWPLKSQQLSPSGHFWQIW